MGNKTRVKKTIVPSLSYNAMFKAVISNNKFILYKMIEAILEYCKVKVNVDDSKVIIKNNELPLGNYYGKQFICDFIIKLNDDKELNIEINHSNYNGLVERNLAYSFKIYYEYFNAGDKASDFKNYSLIQVNFNKFPNLNGKRFNKFMFLDLENVETSLSESLKIINIDIESCYNIVYNNDNQEEISDLDRLSAMINCESVEDISYVLGSGILTMKEKEKLLKSIEEVGTKKNVLKAVKLEETYDQYMRNIIFTESNEAKRKGFTEGHQEGFTEGRQEGFTEGRQEGLAEGLEEGRQEGTEETVLNVVKSMLKENFSYEIISKVTGKSISEIKEIEQSLNKD